MSALPKEVQDVVDSHQIQAVINQYCRALDRCDLELLKDVYWPDAIHNHGIFDGGALEFAEYAMPEIARVFAKTQHHICNVNVELHGDVAHTESYLLAFHSISSDPEIMLEVFGPEYAAAHADDGVDAHDYILIARYHDRLEKRDGTWRIAVRTVSVEWTINQPGSAVAGVNIANAIHRQGARDRTDLSYAR
jgi:hypothetical protein